MKARMPGKASRHINVRMTVYYSLVIALFTICLTAAISTILVSKWKDEMSKVVDQKVDLINNQISQEIKRLEKVHFSMVNNTVIQDYMKKELSGGGLNEEEQEALTREFQKVKQSHADIISALPANVDGDIMDNRSTNTMYGSLTGSREFSQFKNTQKLRHLSEPNTFPLEIQNPSLQEKGTGTSYGRYYDNETYETLGYILVNWKKSSLFGDSGIICENTFQESFIADQNGACIYEKKEAGQQETLYQQMEGKLQNGKVTIDGERYLVYQQSISAYPEWKFTGLISYKGINRNLWQIYLVMFCIAVVMFLIVVMVSFRISKGITRPIQDVLGAMEQLGKGGEPKPLEASTKDEIQVLVNGFNTMSSDIQNLKKQIIRDEEEKKDYEVAVMKSRLNLLQSQINPHFIHNTLNTLKYMAQKEENGELADTITAFNMLLRTSMTTDKDYISVSEEVDNIFNYMKIQKQRYDADVKIRFIILDDTDNAMIPKLIMQPLVENSLFHGIMPKGGGTVIITTAREGGWVKVSVSDDGVGIPQEIQGNILKEKKNSKRGYTNIGLANVNERLHLYYGEESRLTILSSKEFGTFISFMIPYKEFGDE